MEILEALALVEHDNDEHWTQSGLVRLEIISELVGETVKREEITAIAPDFKRGIELSPMNPEVSDNEPNEGEQITNETPPIPEPPQEQIETFQEAEPSTLSPYDRQKLVVDDLRDELSKLDQSITKLQVQAKEVARQLNRADRELEHLRPADSQTANVRAYINSQNKIRAQRAERMAALKESGIAELIGNIVPTTPLQQAGKNRRADPATEFKPRIASGTT